MIDVLVVGIGEYVTGLSGEGVAKSDKSFGVIALSLFDMRERGVVGEIHLAGRDAKRFDLIREHFDTNLKAAYPSLDTSFEAHPKEGFSDEAYQEALKQMPKGSCVMIFTPDDTHFKIVKDALEEGMHVLVAKPLVKTTEEHLALQKLAK